jgi:ABC-type multidrug transport system permease subunit
MDITTLGNTLRRMTLAFAIISAILPAYFLGSLVFTILTGSEYNVGPKELFVVSILGGLSVLLFAIYIFLELQNIGWVLLAEIACGAIVWGLSVPHWNARTV